MNKLDIHTHPILERLRRIPDDHVIIDRDLYRIFLENADLLYLIKEGRFRAATVRLKAEEEFNKAQSKVESEAYNYASYLCPGCNYEVSCQGADIDNIPECPRCGWTLEEENASRWEEGKSAALFCPFIPTFLGRISREQKKACPWCGRGDYSSTLVAYSGKDMNKVSCSYCSWRGLGHELVDG